LVVAHWRTKWATDYRNVDEVSSGGYWSWWRTRGIATRVKNHTRVAAIRSAEMSLIERGSTGNVGAEVPTGRLHVELRCHERTTSRETVTRMIKAGKVGLRKLCGRSVPLVSGEDFVVSVFLAALACSKVSEPSAPHLNPS
jgi:hypothetical protein